MAGKDPLVNGHFNVTIDGITLDNIVEISGLTYEIEIAEQTTVNAKKTINSKYPGPVKGGEFTVSRPMNGDVTLAAWIEKAALGASGHKSTASVEFMSIDDKKLAAWDFKGCVPKKLEMPSLKAGGKDVGVEKLTVAYEAFVQVPIK